jgi:hypothetical protein
MDHAPVVGYLQLMILSSMAQLMPAVLEAVFLPDYLWRHYSTRAGGGIKK